MSRYEFGRHLRGGVLMTGILLVAMGLIVMFGGPLPTHAGWWLFMGGAIPLVYVFVMRSWRPSGSLGTINDMVEGHEYRVYCQDYDDSDCKVRAILVCRPEWKFIAVEVDAEGPLPEHFTYRVIRDPAKTRREFRDRFPKTLSAR